jgi:hypothetical protein
MQMNYGRAVRELIDSGAVPDRSSDQDLDLEGAGPLAPRWTTGLCLL